MRLPKAHLPLLLLLPRLRLYVIVEDHVLNVMLELLIVGAPVADDVPWPQLHLASQALVGRHPLLSIGRASPPSLACTLSSSLLFHTIAREVGVTLIVEHQTGLLILVVHLLLVTGRGREVEPNFRKIIFAIFEEKIAFFQLKKQNFVQI